MGKFQCGEAALVLGTHWLPPSNCGMQTRSLKYLCINDYTNFICKTPHAEEPSLVKVVTAGAHDLPPIFQKRDSLACEGHRSSHLGLGEGALQPHARQIYAHRQQVVGVVPARQNRVSSRKMVQFDVG